mgnify:CR=1 FL=1
MAVVFTWLVGAGTPLVAQVLTASDLATAVTRTAVKPVEWTRATATNTAVTVAVDLGVTLVTISVRVRGDIDGGVLDFEVNNGDGMWFPFAIQSVAGATIGGRYEAWRITPVTIAWQASAQGWALFRVRLGTPIAGAGTLQMALVAR